ncbi:MAG: 50S ribosomal protein L25 [Patescibacteria group bacterium]|nr:50S ribosomal protein L25 [Patescibacteria group bacterium]
MKDKTNKKIKLSANIRNLKGKKTKKLRKQGIIPANIYGSDFKSLSISVNLKDFFKVYKTSKETGIVYLEVDKKEIPVLIKNVQKHPITDQIIHIDFRKIDLKKKLETEVPIKIVGQSEAVNQKGGVLLIQSNSIKIEAFPEDIPQEIEIDITKLKEIGQEIKISDLQKSEKYEFKDESNKIIVSIIEHKEQDTKPETSTVTPEVISEKKAEEKKEENNSENKNN